MINQELDEEEAELRAIRQNEIDACKNAIAGEQSSQADASSWSDIISAKKEAVGLQLEAAYRARLVEAHSQVRIKFYRKFCTDEILHDGLLITT